MFPAMRGNSMDMTSWLPQYNINDMVRAGGGGEEKKVE